MAKQNVTVSPALDTKAFDIGAISAALDAAIKGLAGMATARHVAKVSCLAFADSVRATHGSLAPLTATSRDKTATDADKAAYVALKEAYLSRIWGADFMAWVNAPKGTVKEVSKAPKRGMVAQPRLYWQQQKGAKWNSASEGFVPKVLAFVAEDEAAASGDTKAANRAAKAVDAACRDNVNAAVKRIEGIIRDKKDLPANVNAAAFLAFAKLALDALETGKAKQARADMALRALRAGKILI
jgi:hypothetical protein